MIAPHAAPDPITEASVVRRTPRAGTVAVDAGAVVVDELDGRAHALNATGALVWECLDGTVDLAGLIDDLTAGFRVDRSSVATDVLDLARELARLGLLDGFATDAGAWPKVVVAPGDDECEPDADDAPPSFDDRYLAVPPNG